MSHAILAPSSASRWMACTPSARLELLVPNDETDFSREGTIAHAVAEYIFRNRKFDKKGEVALIQQFGQVDFDKFFDKAMLRHAEDFVAYVRERIGNKVVIMLIEYKLDTSNYIEEGSGTMDVGIIYDDSEHPDDNWWVLETFDYKYGKGVAVYAEDNKQQKIYALGVLNDFGYIYNIREVVMHIYQPRIDFENPPFEISKNKLIEWAETELKPKAQLAFAGKGEFVVGEHCTFCRVKATCRALAEHNLELLAKDFAILTDKEFIEVYKDRKLIEGWIKAVNEYALKQALNGKEWPGYKLVEGISKRRYKDETQIAEILGVLGYKDIWQPEKLLNFEDMEGLLGAPTFINAVVPLLVKPTGAPALAAASDKREKFKGSNAEAFNDGFVDEENFRD